MLHHACASSATNYLEFVMTLLEADEDSLDIKITWVELLYKPYKSLHLIKMKLKCSLCTIWQQLLTF
jgi:hypothetical protein